MDGDLHERRFVLPCGGGTIFLYREWQEPPRIVICARDDRGIYVVSVQKVASPFVLSSAFGPISVEHASEGSAALRSG